MSVIPRRMTYEDLQQTPDDGNRYEIIDGEPIVSPAPSLLHQELVVRLLVLIQAYLVESRFGGKIFPAPVDVRLAEHTVVQPDLVYVSAARSHIRANPAFVNGVPDLVVEILSPSTRAYDEHVKHRLYERAGLPEYWLVDLNREALTILTLRKGAYVATAAQSASRVSSVVLPGLAIDVPALFADLG